MKRVRVAVLAPEIYLRDIVNEYSPRTLLDGMIHYWKGLFEAMMPYRPDIIAMPEISDTPRGLPRDKWKEYWEYRSESFADFISEMAKKAGSYIAYSSSRKTNNDSYRNSTILFDDNGSVVTIYDKVHPTIPELESGTIPGSEAVIADTPYGRMGFIICFDLNFDFIRLKYAGLSPDIMIFSSVYHGGDLKQGLWAYSCQSYMISAVSKKGLSNIRNPFGFSIAETSEYTPFAIADINTDFCLVSLDFNGKKLSELKAKYKDGVQIYEPGKFGEAMIISNCERSANELADEFDMEKNLDYLARSGKLQQAKRNSIKNKNA